MKTKHLVFVLFLFVIFKAEGQGRTIPLGTFSGFVIGLEDYNYYKFSPNNQVEMGTGVRGRQKTGTYTVYNDQGIDFLNVRWNNGENEKFLFLMGDVLNAPNAFLRLYKQDGSPYFFGVTNRWPGHLMPQPLNHPEYITASSHLIEGREIFSIEKLGWKIGECWVEGVPGQGINEKLVLKGSYMGYFPIYISSGFVSYLKPHLYRENSRIKKLKVSDGLGRSVVVELSDTPHFQPIFLNEYFPKDPNDKGEREPVYTLEILEVYAGTRYSDTCVNSLYYLSVFQ